MRARHTSKPVSLWQKAKGRTGGKRRGRTAPGSGKIGTGARRPFPRGFKDRIVNSKPKPSS